MPISKNKNISMIMDIFNSVASKYDLMNDIMSFGIHRIWKSLAVQYSGVYNGHRVLDLAGGTGDLAEKISRIVGDNGKVVLVDINESMLKIGREKLRNRGILGNISYVQANAEALPFPNDFFDCIFISFGLRNFIAKEQALRSAYRVLKFGGRLIILEFSKPSSEFLNKIYNIYSFYILPKIGKMIANDENSYYYLVKSIRTHPDQEKLKSIILSIGFNYVEYFNITGGIVALHRGYKI